MAQTVIVQSLFSSAFTLQILLWGSVSLVTKYCFSVKSAEHTGSLLSAAGVVTHTSTLRAPFHKACSKG